MTPNEAQRQGADPRASAFVLANAGSGKTRVLVDRVARLLLAGAPPARILCLTFTKVAAGEMQERLFRRLGGWAIAEDAPLRAELTALTGESDINLGDARRLFARALDTPGGLKIQTIHAFCERLLRTFPMEAGLAPGFAVAQEAEAARLALHARRDTALAAADDPALAAAFSQVAASRSESSAGALFKWITDNRHDLASLFARYQGADPAIAALRAKLGLAPGEDADAIRAAAWAETPADRLRAAAAAMDAGSPTDSQRAGAIRAALAEPDPQAAWGLYMAAVRTKAGGRLARGLCTKGVRTGAPDIAALFGDDESAGTECARIDAVQDRLKAAACADLTGAALRIARAFIGAYEARKAALRLLDFSDLIHRALALLEDSEAREWVRYKLDGGVDHILVDEAQDNSPQQWRIVDAAAEEFFTGAGASQAVRTLFAVGDEKQSIFSFQGAAPALFRDQSQLYSARAYEASLTFHAPPLETSFRSASLILGAVDHVFSGEAVATRMQVLDADGAPPAGDLMRHVAFRDDRPGCVELWPALPAPEEADDGDPAAPVDAPRPDHPKLDLARKIATRIKEMINARASVRCPDTNTDRAMRAGDALILVRRRDGFFEEMIRQLKLAGLPVAGADRITLTEQTAAKDLMALARFALLPEDDLSLAELLRSPFFQPAGGPPVITEEALFDLAHSRTGRLWDALRATGDPRFAEAKAVLGEALAGVGVAAPYEFFAGFLNRLAPEGASFARRLHARLGPEAEDPVQEFLARAMAHQRAGAPSLQRFLAGLEAETGEIRREMDAARDEVRVMTVHGAKGLEAPVVFLPDTTWSQRRSDGMFPDPECGLIWSPKKDLDPPAAAALREAQDAREDAEYLRLLYVALTRARDHLIVAGARFGQRSDANPEGRIDDGCWHELVEQGLRRADAVEVGTPAGPGLRLGEAPGAAPAAEPPAPPAPPPDWARASLPAERGARAATPSHLLDEGAETTAATSPLSRERETRYLRGSLIHKLLELLPELAPERRAGAAASWLARRSELSAEAQAEIAEAALGVLARPDFAHVFGPDSRAEQPVAGILPGGRKISGSVDRLVVRPDEVLIVDYKTNRPPPADISGADPAYIAQMAAYRAVLSSVFPGRGVRCALLWTDAPALMDIPDEMMDRALGALARA